MQRATQTFHMPTSDRWRTIAAGDELADDDPAVTAAPQFFVAVANPAPTPADQEEAGQGTEEQEKPAPAPAAADQEEVDQGTADQEKSDPVTEGQEEPAPAAAEPAAKKPRARRAPTRGKSA